MKNNIGLSSCHYRLLLINISVMVTAVVFPPMLCLSIFVLLLIQDTPQCPSLAIRVRQNHWLAWALCMLCAIILPSSVSQYVLASASIFLLLRLPAINVLNS